MSDKRRKTYPQREAYAAGFQAGDKGRTPANTAARHFKTPALSNAWQRGLRDSQRLAMAGNYVRTTGVQMSRELTLVELLAYHILESDAVSEHRSFHEPALLEFAEEHLPEWYVVGMPPVIEILQRLYPEMFTEDGRLRRCRVCGCTFLHPCPAGCSWVAPDRCSACRDKPKASPPRSPRPAPRRTRK